MGVYKFNKKCDSKCERMKFKYTVSKDETSDNPKHYKTLHMALVEHKGGLHLSQPRKPHLKQKQDPKDHPAIPNQGTQSTTQSIQMVSEVVESTQASERTEAVERTEAKPKKKYSCSVLGCDQFFYQQTHLEIHRRAHIGLKPYVCKEPSCGQRFSNLGNLKTHKRRHTGDRPYTCDVCGKGFAQRGNLRAHKIVHDATKTFTCDIDRCGKKFPQLENLTAHQDEFHPEFERFLYAKWYKLSSGEKIEYKKTVEEFNTRRRGTFKHKASLPLPKISRGSVSFDTSVDDLMWQIQSGK